LVLIVNYQNCFFHTSTLLQHRYTFALAIPVHFCVLAIPVHFKKCPGINSIILNSEIFSNRYTCKKCSGRIFQLTLQ
jgi:hypothetical protein